MCRGEYMITKYILGTCIVSNEVDFSKENYDTGKVGNLGYRHFLWENLPYSVLYTNRLQIVGIYS